MVKTNEKKGKGNVLIYSTPTCQYCHKTKEFLNKHGIKFKDIDVSSDSKAAKEMVEKSGQMGVPVIDINGTIIVGFDESALRKALEIR